MKKKRDNKSKNKNSVGVITVLLQDYFHRGVFRTLIGEKQWTRFESRLDRNVDDTLRMLDDFGVKATFFTLGWIGEKFPAIIKRIADERHEIASAGFWARAVAEMKLSQFREDICRAREALQIASGKQVIGYRCAYRYIRDSEWWALSVLSEEGHIYDASYCPRFIGRDSSGMLKGAQQVAVNGRTIWEFPTSTKSILGIHLPISGGNYLRQFPHRMMFRYFEEWLRREEDTFVLYFHPWELDEEQPFIKAIGWISRMKQYRNLGKMSTILPHYFERATFMPIRDFLGIKSVDALDVINTLDNKRRQSFLGEISHYGYNGQKPVTVVIPCFNEESSLPYLENTLAELEMIASQAYDLKFVFVDDCSSDRTLAELKRRFGKRSNCRIVHHDKNQGIAKAITTGINHSDTEVVCSMDADCSYDPLELIRMIPELNENTDIVTASPYHPQGFVLAVPGWRLFLSKSLSRLYHLLLRHKLFTYTSCFRAYRKSSVKNINLRYGDFRGIVELLARLDIAGKTIKEYPTTLQSRIFGYSKMKTFKTILGHLGLLLRICIVRIKSTLRY